MKNRLDRELSWINYNSRVLEEGLRNDLPALDRFRFLSIVSSNFDEFFMVRIAALKRAIAENPDSSENSVLLLNSAMEMIRPLFAKLYKCLDKDIFPGLAKGGLELRRPPFSPDETGYLKPLFMREILPVLTPLRFGGLENWTTPLPAIANGILYGAFLLKGTEPETTETEPCISIVEIPPTLDRIIRIDTSGTHQRWALLDDLLMLWGGSLFPGYEVKERLFFRIYRDADFSVDEKRDDDFIEAMEEVIIRRDSSPAVQIVYSSWHYSQGKTDTTSSVIIQRLGLSNEDAFSLPGPLHLQSLDSLFRIQGFDSLKRKTSRPHPHPSFSSDISIWDTIRAGDILLNLPYQSFDPVVRFFQEAASDPLVLSVKTTLYRTSGNSPIVRALEQAALSGKQVTAMVELKARFDEERNISWVKQLERAGVIVIYGLAMLKVHAKISQIIRKEETGIVRYLHFSTGNYNDKTARAYSDICLFSCREDFSSDATSFFNIISGYSSPLSMRSLVMAPHHLKQRLIDLIDREAKRAKEGLPGRITAKMNALVDNDVADALYRASGAGVKINLNIRGICTLVPGVPGLSENIRVVSIIDRFLEHSRVVYFNNGGAEEFFISSADWMPRNLERRVELLIPVYEEETREELRSILEAYFKDNTNSWNLRKDGNWERLAPQSGEKPFSVQNFLQEQAEKAAASLEKAPREFTIRRGGKPAMNDL